MPSPVSPTKRSIVLDALFGINQILANGNPVGEENLDKLDDALAAIAKLLALIDRAIARNNPERLTVGPQRMLNPRVTTNLMVRQQLTATNYFFMWANAQRTFSFFDDLPQQHPANLETEASLSGPAVALLYAHRQLSSFEFEATSREDRWTHDELTAASRLLATLEMQAQGFSGPTT